MIAIEISSVEKTIKSFAVPIKSFVAEFEINLTELLKDEKVKKDSRQIKYIEKIIEYKNSIINGQPDILAAYKTEFDSIFQASDVNKKEWKIFKDKILQALNYKVRRSDFYPTYFNKIRIKTCVYCNSQLCISVRRKDGVVLGKFQVDHYISKNSYPCFSISLYNLYPTCAPCNSIKGIKNLDFNLYEKTPSKSRFNFKIKKLDKTLIKYFIENERPNLEIEFYEPKTNPKFKSFEEVFDITGIYSSQADIAEELILKTKLYPDAYKEDLLNSFPLLFSSIDELNRVIIGNYTNENEIHNRPMSKFTQDISRQLGLIK